MELLMEFLFELIVEGAIEGTKMKKIPKFIRYILLIFISCCFLFIAYLMFYLAFIISKNWIMSLLFIGVGIMCIIFVFRLIKTGMSIR